ncbi:spexin [Arvicanthis niloticus]|uniref:spexin n=1 Tax=Arvicanthis niloticus TaxID=61156 RepID=UPI00148662AE|nr:spexin [Arvicanthis niloticus]
MKGPNILTVTALALLLVLSVLENSSGAPQRLSEKRNWTPQAMLYLKGAQGRRFISDQSRRKELADRPPPERRNPDLQLLTLPEAAALFLASLEKPQKGADEGGNFAKRKLLEDKLLNW